MGLFRAELGHTYDDLRLGQKASFTRLVTKQDVLQYMGLCGDLNPLYADASYAGRTRYGQTIVPVNMLAGFLMGAVATVLPGLGSVTHAHAYRMISPVRVGDEISTEMEITAMKPEIRHVVIRYRLGDHAGREIMTGEIEVEPPDQLKPILQHVYENF